jgi:hypothetical protein
MRRLIVLLTLISSVPFSHPAGALSTFYGEDLGIGMVPASFPNASATEASFQAQIGAGNFDTESFESFADKDAGELNIFQGGPLSLTGVLSDSVVDGGEVRLAPLDDAANLGFPISSDGFWQNETTSDASNEIFRVTFSDEVFAFGFYATAWSTQSTEGATSLVLDLHLSGGDVTSIAIPHDQSGDLAGSVFYFGVIADLPFVAAAVRNSTEIDPGDRIGFDEFTVAVSVAAVPEPNAAILFVVGLAIVEADRRRRVMT